MDSEYRTTPPRRRRPSPSLWVTLNKILILPILLLLGVIIFFVFSPQITRLRSMQKTLDEKNTELANEQLAQKRNDRKRTLLEKNTEYIETIARDTLDKMKPDETIFRIETTKTE